ncbi:hypothetical protein SmJEL517_g02703 [Synchytrium microbalum]|uniref:Major facilitator superfamily (MFS) profile domain-containing protein n=1 Tax=Synchytrium microbalum TaxID=1806994 RepID=A0A507C6D2_9FUNG|nr:uncharacterized protein SmJEL517_g02703 [Synchytrium microbalum]TPX34669.1 hypothetical protein SmJEL517_g02703 [Synchytrium microbalum]
MTKQQKLDHKVDSNDKDHDKDPKSDNGILLTIFLALLIDILAFTIILPLLPRILEYYDRVDGSNPETSYFMVKSAVRAFRTSIGGTGSELDIVLFGGILGSLFSFLQFVSSPWIGKWSDTYGRKPVLLVSMIGNGLSMILWTVSNSFPLFVLSRVVGGLTEGNVQMSIAMISDITTPRTRSRGLALVGIAFALGFTVGPPLGAYFANIDLRHIPALRSLPLSAYASPALFALVLLVIETIYLYACLPETLGRKRPSKKDEGAKSPPSPSTNSVSIETLSLLHFFYLFIFSGMEFTLTFLVHDRFSFTHAQQGALLGFIGILSAFIQGGYVRRLGPGHEGMLVVRGMVGCCAALVLLSIANSVQVLYLSAVGFAFASGTVVTSLTSLASLACGKVEMLEDGEGMGSALGRFRAYGQLGRSLGPVAACSAYWLLGSTRCYISGTCLMGGLLMLGLNTLL